MPPRYANGHISARGDPIHFMFGSRVGFSGTADRTALFPVRTNSNFLYARPYVFTFYVTVCECHIALKVTWLWLDLTCWLGLLTCKNRLPYNLYCVGGDVKHCTIQSNPIRMSQQPSGRVPTCLFSHTFFDVIRAALSKLLHTVYLCPQ